MKTFIVILTMAGALALQTTLSGMLAGGAMLFFGRATCVRCHCMRSKRLDT